MKRYLLIFALIGLFFYGCTNESDITSPEQSINMAPNWIALPQAEGMQIERSFTVTKKINGTQGGFLTMYESYSGGPFGRVTIDAELVFEQGSYPGNKDIYMTNDDFNCASTFEPSFEKFNRVVTFNIKYTGINLSNIDPNNVKFAYISPNGELEYAANEGIIVNVSTGTIQVVNAIIDHFSRYGFVN